MKNEQPIRYPHRPGYVRQELARMADELGPISEQHVRTVFAEALMMLLDRTDMKSGPQ
jgi:hypothetical protein